MIGQKFYGGNNTGTITWGLYLDYYEIIEEHEDYVVIDQHIRDFVRGGNIHPPNTIVERIAIMRPKCKLSYHPEYKTFEFSRGYSQLDQAGRNRDVAEGFKHQMTKVAVGNPNPGTNAPASPVKVPIPNPKPSEKVKARMVPER